MIRSSLKVSESPQQQGFSFISVNNAGKELGVERTTMYYYMKQLFIEAKSFHWIVKPILA
jgi:hypothetical protein